MNEQLAKEARRNLRKEMGQTATDAVERARAEVLKLRMEHAAIARELAEWKTVCQRMFLDYDRRDAALDARVDGASAWCDKNEQFMQTCVRETETLRRWRVELEGASVWRRLRWVLNGVIG